MTSAVHSESHHNMLLALLPFNHGEWAHANLTRLSLFLKNPQSFTEPELFERFLDAKQTFITKTTHAIEVLMSRCRELQRDHSAIDQLRIRTINLNNILKEMQSSPDQPLSDRMLEETEAVKESLRIVRQEALRSFQASPTEILQSVLASLQPMLENHGVTVTGSHDDTSTIVCITPQTLFDVLRSLFDHALDAMRESQQRSLDIRSYEKALWWVVEIKDSGKGIPLEQWKTVFDNTTSNPQTGRLGFGAMREHLRLFEGEIAIKESTVGTGTTMLLRLKKI